MKTPSQQDISRIIPNTFPFPNFYIDTGIWALLKPEEQSCIVIVARKTYGWWKQSDRIAVSQLAKLTGMSDNTVRKVMARLVIFGLVICLSSDTDNGDPRGKEWSLQTDDQKVGYTALEWRKTSKAKLNATRSKGLKNQTPIVPRKGTPNVARDPSPHVARDPQNHSKPPSKKGIPSRSSLIQDALAKHFKLTLTLSWKSHREFLCWAVDQAHITPEQIEYAKNTFDDDEKLNWNGKKDVSLPFLQEKWLQLIDGFSTPVQEYGRDSVIDMNGI